MEETKITETVIHKIEGSVKIEATIGLAITGLIMTFIIDGVLQGIEMPDNIGWVLLLLFIGFFLLRLANYLKFIIEKFMYLQEQKVQADIQQKTLITRIRKLELEVQLKQLEVAESG